MKNKKIGMYPKKVIKNRNNKIVMGVFIGVLLLIASIIALVLFWEDILKFVTKSGIIFILAILIMGIFFGCSYVVKKITEHSEDDF